MKTKIIPMKSPQSGKAIPNQNIIKADGKEFFQSYNTIIAMIDENGNVTLDPLWKTSSTTSKYRSIFLNESTKETHAKVVSGEYQIEDLN